MIQQVKLISADEKLVIALSGEIDSASVDEFYAQVSAIYAHDKKDIVFLKTVQNRCHFTGLFYGRSGSDLEMYAHFIGNNSGKSCLPEPRWAIKENVI